MHDDHAGGFKECLYTNDITIVGKNDGCDVWVEGEGVELNSLWAIGPAFIIFLAGSLFSSIYLMFWPPKMLRATGSKVKVTDIETNRPTVIIQPKSIIGFIPLKIKDKKAHMVVSTV